MNDIREGFEKWMREVMWFDSIDLIYDVRRECYMVNYVHSMFQAYREGCINHDK